MSHIDKMLTSYNVFFWQRQKPYHTAVDQVPLYWLVYSVMEWKITHWTAGIVRSLFMTVYANKMLVWSVEVWSHNKLLHYWCKWWRLSIFHTASPTAQPTPAGHEVIAIPLGIVGSIVFIIVAAVLICIVVLRRRKIKSKEPMLMSDLSR